MKNSHAVFVFTISQKWKGLSIFTAIMVLFLMMILSIYPEFTKIATAPTAELSGDGLIGITLTEDSKTGNFTLGWDRVPLAEGYALVQSDAEFNPLDHLGQMNFTVLPDQLEGVRHDPVVTLVEPGETEFTIADLAGEWGRGTVVYLAVMPYVGPAENATVQVVSGLLNTGALVASTPFDALMESSFYEAWGVTSDFLKLGPFLDMEFFGSTMVFALIFLIRHYTASFAREKERKTIDLLMSTPLSRRTLFVSRYLAWTAVSVALVIIFWLVIVAGVSALGETDQLSAGRSLLACVLLLPFLLVVQGMGMLGSVLFDETRKATGFAMGLFFGMFILQIMARLSEGWDGLKYLSVFHYWDTSAGLSGREFPWSGTILLTALAAALFVASLSVFEKRDLAT